MRDGVIHVAGIKDAEEAGMLIDCGVSHLGFPLVLDNHEEDLSVEAAAKIVSQFESCATFFLITYLNQAADIVRLCRKLHVDMVQLHGDISPDELKRLRAEQPGWRIVKSLVVTGDNTGALIGDIERFAPWVDAFITDTYDPATGARGATGKTHDWGVSRRLVEISPKPVILAGGLNPGNVHEAICTVRPAGVDVHTGIEGDAGRKRRDLTSRFVAETHKAFAEID
ncbi:MAG: phosphoribosylanthranilate isomerase [Methyloceanibacter sp.]